MMTPRLKRAVFAGAGLVPVLALLVAAGWNRHALPPPRDEPMRTAGVPAPRVLPPSDSFKDIAARPLFLASRKPMEGRAPAAASLQPPSAILAAVILAPEKRSALVRLQNRKTVSVSEGQTLEGWSVAEIAADHVLLRAGAAEHRLAFPKPAGSHPRPPGQP